MGLSLRRHFNWPKAASRNLCLLRPFAGSWAEPRPSCLRCLLLIGLLLSPGAQARVLEVGPSRELPTPSAAATIARNGDTVRIDPGEYLDCTIWRADGLTIEGAAAGVVLSDTACAGKALFVIAGNATTVRELTITRLRVADGNGAGIRLEGSGLTLERVRFVNNQVGVLTAPSPDSHIRIIDSEFLDNGACSDRGCVGALVVGPAAELIVERSIFQATHGGHHIVSAADDTFLRSNHIADGADGTAGYAVQYVGDGSLRMQDNMLDKGPHTGNLRAEVLAGGYDWGGAHIIEMRRNTYLDHSGASVPLLLNWTEASPILDHNNLLPGTPETSSSGVWLHRLRLVVVTTKDQLRHLAGLILHAL